MHFMCNRKSTAQKFSNVECFEDGIIMFSFGADTYMQDEVHHLFWLLLVMRDLK